jgi:fumarylpyruvate hydrolase
MQTLFPKPSLPLIPVQGRSQAFPVGRIFCVGRNYADHAREMGVDPATHKPVFFMKPASAIVVPHGASLPFPTLTDNLHHEVELAVGLGQGGRNMSLSEAESAVLAYGVALDMTRRDLQEAAKAKQGPWDIAKAFDQSCPLSPLILKEDCGVINQGRISLHLNGQLRQNGDLSQMILSVPDLIAALSHYFTLQAGDIILTGTPEGVGPVRPGELLEAEIEGVGRLSLSYAAL